MLLQEVQISRSRKTKKTIFIFCISIPKQQLRKIFLTNDLHLPQCMIIYYSFLFVPRRTGSIHYSINSIHCFITEITVIPFVSNATRTILIMVKCFSGISITMRTCFCKSKTMERTKYKHNACERDHENFLLHCSSSKFEMKKRIGVL